MTQTKLRKRTVFLPCPKHEGYMADQTRQRRAEFMIEGGLAGHDPCNCRMKPGTDLFVPAFVAEHADGCGIQGR